MEDNKAAPSAPPPLGFLGKEKRNTALTLAAQHKFITMYSTNYVRVADCSPRVTVVAMVVSIDAAMLSPTMLPEKNCEDHVYIQRFPLAET